MSNKILSFKTAQSATATVALYVFLCSSIMPFTVVPAASLMRNTFIINEDKSRFIKNETEQISQKSVPTEKVKNALGSLPVSFEINQGQMDKRVKFLSRGKGYSLFLMANESVLSLRKSTPEEVDGKKLPTPKQSEKQANEIQTALRTKFVGANQNPRIEGLELLAAKTNYFTGKDQKNWRTNVSQYAKVKYSEVYPGIDVIYYGKGQGLEYDFVVAPGADPRKIKMQFKGADKIKVDDNGDLVLSTKSGDVRHRKPFIYQEVDGERRQINGRYRLLSKKRVGFQIDSYDQTKPLVIDPVIVYSTILGGTNEGSWASANNIATYTAADGRVYVYIVGSTWQSDFSVKNAAYPVFGGNGGTTDGDAFVAKFDMSLSGEASLIYSTFLGGNGGDDGRGIAVDSAGNAYVVGLTRSTNFPILKAVQPFIGGADFQGDAFITVLTSNGSSLIYSTYIGGSGRDEARDVAVDSFGNAYISGATSSSNFVTINPYQSTIEGSHAAFVTKIEPPAGLNSASVSYSTYLGEVSEHAHVGIAVDSTNIYVTGTTRSPNFPTLNGYQTQLRCSRGNAFVTKLNPAASGADSLLYSTYLGGSCLWEGDVGLDIAVDSAGNAYVTGVTVSNDFPTTEGTFMRNRRTSDTGFVAKIDTTKSGAASLIYSTLLGGFGGERIEGIAVDAEGNAYVTGVTYSYDFPLVNASQAFYSGVFQSINGGDSWNLMNSGLVVPKVNAIAIDTSTSPRTLYAGAGNHIHHRDIGITATGGVFKSTNGGLSWNAVNNGLTNLDVKSLLISPANPSTIYAANGDGVFRSTDGGSNWSALNNGLDSQVNTLVADTNTVNGVTTVTIYAGSDTGLYKMNEGANAWSVTGNIDPIATVVIDSKSSPHTVYTVNVHGWGASKSLDGGDSWTSLAIPDRQIYTLAIDESTTPSTLYAVEANAYVYGEADIIWKSFDGGANWQSLTSTNPACCTDPDGLSLIVDNKTTPSTFYIADDYGVFMSNDGAATWNRISTKGISAMVLDRSSTATQTPMYVGTLLNYSSDAFVSKLNPTGSALLFSTTLGGYESDGCVGIALDLTGNIYVAGRTQGGQFSTVNAYQETASNSTNAFVLKLGSAALPTSSTETVTTEVIVQTGTLEVALPNIQSTNTNGGPAPTTSVEPIDNSTTANLTVSNNLGAYEIKVNNAVIDTTGYFSTGCMTNGIAVPCWEKHGIKIAFSVPTVNDVAVFNNLVISHGEDTDNNPNTPLVLVPYDQSFGNARHTYKDFANRKIWVYVPSLSPFVILKGASDQISDLIKLTSSFNLKQGIQNSLDAKLKNAQKAFLAAKSGDKATACNIMKAFISEVQAQTGKSITTAQAQQLLISAKQIQVVLGCS